MKVNADPSTVSELVEEVSVRIFSMFSVYCCLVISALFMFSLILFQMQTR